MAGPSRPSVQLPNGLLQVQAVAPPLAPPQQAAPPYQAREKGPCVGDTRLIFHNRQGEATDTAMAFESLEHRLLPRAAVVAIAEAGWDAKMIDVVEKRMRTKCHRLYCAPANGRAPRGSVTAIVVRADVEQVEGEGLLWKREDGKALIIAVVLSGTPYYVSAAHYPAAEHDDEERAEFETDLRYEYTKARATHGALHPRWKDAGWLRGSDRNMVDRWGTGLDEQVQRRYSSRATRAVNLTRASCNLSDVWAALRPNDPAGLTHGEPGRRRRLDGWEAGTSTIGHELGVVDVRVIPAVQLSVPWKDRKKGLKISDHDAVEVTLRTSTERRPAGEPRIRAGALDIPEVRKYIRQSVAQLKNRPGDAQSRFDLWAADVVSKCHRAYRAQARAAAKERTLLERLVRESHGRHAWARDRLRQARKQAVEQPPQPAARVAHALSQEREHSERLRKSKGRLARHDRGVQRVRAASEQREEAEVAAARGKQRKPPRQPTPPLTYMCTKDAAGTVTQEWKGQEQVAEHQRSSWERVLNMQGWSEQDALEEMEHELRRVSNDSTCQVPEHLLQGFHLDALFHKKNIIKAMNRLKRGSSPGIDKVNAELVLLMAKDDRFVTHVQQLFREWHEAGKMGEASRTAMMTTLFKQAGRRALRLGHVSTGIGHHHTISGIRRLPRAMLIPRDEIHARRPADRVPERAQDRRKHRPRDRDNQVHQQRRPARRRATAHAR